MKTFEQLSDEEKTKAKGLCLKNLLKEICEGSITFSNLELRKKLKTAFDRAEQMRTPWFTHEYVMDTCKTELESIAQQEAEVALYRSPGELVLTLW